jgi:Ca2+-binding EF-hand superfamily protein
VSKFSEIVELYNFFPIKVTKDRNKSNEIYYQMLSNKKSVLAKAPSNHTKDVYLEKLMSILYWKVTERFSKLADAFVFFDVSNDGLLSFQEFK